MVQERTPLAPASPSPQLGLSQLGLSPRLQQMLLDNGITPAAYLAVRDNLRIHQNRGLEAHIARTYHTELMDAHYSLLELYADSGNVDPVTLRGDPVTLQGQITEAQEYLLTLTNRFAERLSPAPAEELLWWVQGGIGSATGLRREAGIALASEGHASPDHSITQHQLEVIGAVIYTDAVERARARLNELLRERYADQPLQEQARVLDILNMQDAGSNGIAPAGGPGITPTILTGLVGRKGNSPTIGN